MRPQSSSSLSSTVRAHQTKLQRQRKARESFMRAIAIEMLEQRQLLSSVLTDQSDYRPGSTALINASDFQAGETISFHIDRTDGVPIEAPPAIIDWQVTDGSAQDLDGQVDGTVWTTWYVDAQFEGASLLASAAGDLSGLTAETAFTDSVSGDNFRTAQTGNWNDINTWQSFTGGIWTAATFVPTNLTAGTIQIQSTHT